MATIIEDMYVTPLISEGLTELDLSKENNIISGYNKKDENKRIPGGLVNAMIKIFLTDQIGIGITKKGEIYTEVMGNQRDEIVSVLYDVKDHNLKACKFKKSDQITKEPLVKGGQCPAFLMIPYMVFQRVQDKYKELEKAWDEIFEAAEDSGFRQIAANDGAGYVIDSAVCGAEEEFEIRVGEVETLALVPGEVYDYTPELLHGKDGTFVLTKAVPKPDTLDPFTTDDRKTYQDQMRELKNKVWPLVKDYYESLSDEDKALVPDEARLGIYIPTKRFVNIVNIVAEGLQNGDMDTQNILLKGPPGVGKSVMAVALAYVFSMPYRFTQSYKTADASEYIGTTIADNGVLKTNIATQFASTVLRGGVHMDDDNNYAAEGEGTVKNSVLIAPYTIKLADGTMAKRHPFSIFMMSANPDMKGARPINEAYKDRFCVIVDLERLSQNEMVRMVRERSKYQDEGDIVRMVEAWEKINADIAAEGESADMLTPRSLVNWAKQTKVIGDPIEACEYNILAALCSSEEYKQNVLNNIIRPLFGRRR